MTRSRSSRAESPAICSKTSTRNFRFLRGSIVPTARMYGLSRPVLARSCATVSSEAGAKSGEMPSGIGKSLPRDSGSNSAISLALKSEMVMMASAFAAVCLMPRRRLRRFLASANCGKRSKLMSKIVTTLRPRSSGGRRKFVKWKTSAGPERRSKGGKPTVRHRRWRMAPGMRRDGVARAPGMSTTPLRKKSR